MLPTNLLNGIIFCSRTLVPLYQSGKAVSDGSQDVMQYWVTFWIIATCLSFVFGVLELIQHIIGLSIPLYQELKTGLFVALAARRTGLAVSLASQARQWAQRPEVTKFKETVARECSVLIKKWKLDELWAQLETLEAFVSSFVSEISETKAKIERESLAPKPVEVEEIKPVDEKLNQDSVESENVEPEEATKESMEEPGVGPQIVVS